ncbi:MAG TPA: GNAT family N-acetyltransferase [Thermomicrobiales bacterium]|nr:GNAT family N-acetyltransferase [Thermomicrobiales bacterium]
MGETGAERSADATPGGGAAPAGAVAIGLAAPSDAEAISALCAACWWDTYRALVADESIEQAIAEYYHPARIREEIGRGSWLVAADRGALVGAARGHMVEDDAGEVFDLYIAPERQRRGVGTRLLRALTERQLAQGATEQWTSVLKANRKGMTFFDVRGFVTWDQRSTRRMNRDERSPYQRLWRYV